MIRSLTTKLLHLLLAAAIVHQLVITAFMHRPSHSHPGGNLAYAFHQDVGLASIAILFAFWLWAFIRHREHGIAALVPWFSRSRRKAVFDDLLRHLQHLRYGDLPQPEGDTPLASAVHGLGLLVATAMALSGGAIYVMLGPAGQMTAAAQAVLFIHSSLANLMWAYLIGHASLAVIHEAMGHPVFPKMFSTHARKLENKTCNS